MPTPTMPTAPSGVLAGLRAWTARRYVVAAGVAVLTVVVIGIPTVLIPNSIFGRDVPVTWWAWPALIVTAILAGLVTASYVRSPLAAQRRDRQGAMGMIGGVMGFFAVGCPVCNKLVLLALGTSGALQFFQPIQPLLALLSIGLLAWALITRIKRESSCTVPVSTSSGPTAA